MRLFAVMFALSVLMSDIAYAEQMCRGFGPQAPRDISEKWGRNDRSTALAPPSEKLNLCNIHIHRNAEHRGPGFSIFAGDGEDGGWKCNGTHGLTARERQMPGGLDFHGVRPGDTVEVHWVFTSCDITPGQGLGACLSDTCKNPQLRVESQAFLLVNDRNALNFISFVYGGNIENGLHQPFALPDETGDPVVYAGSTTGPRYSDANCSPYHVTWSVRPQCNKLDINSLGRWARKGNIFQEDHSHGVRELVTHPSLLSRIR